MYLGENHTTLSCRATPRPRPDSRSVAMIVAVIAVGCGTAPREAARSPGAPKPLPAAPLPSAAPPAKHDVTAPAAPAGPPPELLQPGTPTGQFGTSAPMMLHTSAPDGRWLSWCEARQDTNGDGHLRVLVNPQGALEGDTSSMFFAVGGGSGRPIDSFVSSSRDGRYVALIESGRLVVLDTVSHTKLDLSELGASLATDLASYLPHRAATFSPSAPLVLFYRNEGDAESVVVRDLVTAEEIELAPPAGNLWRASFDESGRFVVAQVVEVDTNKNRRLDWPHPKAREDTPSPIGRGCSPPIPRIRVWRFPGDTPTPHVARLGSTTWTRVTGFIRPVGDELLVRGEDGQLELLGAGSKRLVVNEKCDARVLHVDASRRKVLAACMGSKVRGEVVVLGGPERIPLEVRVAGFELDRWERDDPRLLALYPGQAALLVDMDTLTLHSLAEGDHVVATSDTTALVRDRKAARFVDIAGATTEIGPLRLYEETLQVGTVVAVPPFVVDVRSRSVLGTYDSPAHAVSSSGKVLVAQGHPGDWDQLPTGPMTWTAPTPPAN